MIAVDHRSARVGSRVIARTAKNTYRGVLVGSTEAHASKIEQVAEVRAALRRISEEMDRVYDDRQQRSGEV